VIGVLLSLSRLYLDYHPAISQSYYCVVGLENVKLDCLLLIFAVESYGTCFKNHGRTRMAHAHRLYLV
jgi:hypothetical protein